MTTKEKELLDILKQIVMSECYDNFKEGTMVYQARKLIKEIYWEGK